MKTYLSNVKTIELLSELYSRDVDLIKIETTMNKSLKIIKVNKGEVYQELCRVTKGEKDEYFDELFERNYSGIKSGEVEAAIVSYLVDYLNKKIEEDYLPF